VKKVGTEAILVVIVSPFAVWFLGFVFSTYQVAAEVSSLKQDIQEVRQNVKEIHSFLLNKGK
jgi:cell division protein FtsL